MVRIFVSSTFGDMHIERDCLEDIQQDINYRLSETGEKIEFLDLRWGICTEELDEENKNKAVLEGCFSAIDKSDYLLVFLGNRYGSSKSYDEVIEYLGKKKTDILFNNSTSNKSITELEISYAQLIKNFNADNTIVCLREENEVEPEAQQLINSFTGNKEYSDLIIGYKSSKKEKLKNNLRTYLLKLIENHIQNETRFDRDLKRLSNIAADSILNTRMGSYKLNKQLSIFSGESGIGKTNTAAEIIQNSINKNTLLFATWETNKKSITYPHLLELIKNAFHELFKDTADSTDNVTYLKNCISNAQKQGYDFLLFLDSENKISNINYRELLDIIGDSRLVVSTNKHQEILSKLHSFKDYEVFTESDIRFDTNEIADIIKGTFWDHGKTVRNETIAILCQKRDITNPIYLHYAINRLLFLKRNDFELCKPNESPEVKVLSKIATELPDTLNDLLIYSIKNIYKNSDIPEELALAINLLSSSFGGITDDVLIDFLIYKGVEKNKKSVLPYLYEIKNRLESFITHDGKWINRKYAIAVYNWAGSVNDVVNFVEHNKTDYKNEYFIQEYMYCNRKNADKLYSFMSARCLWKFENKKLRRIYRKCFWNLIEKALITTEIIDKKFFIEATMFYKEYDEYGEKNFREKACIFQLLTENLQNEYHNFEEADGIFLLYRLASIYLDKLGYIYRHGLLVCVSDIPMDLLDLFENLAFLYKTISKTLLTIKYNLSAFYKLLLDKTLDYLWIINSLYCAEMLIENKDNRSVRYYHSSVRILSSLEFFINLGDYDERFQSDAKNSYNGIYFNWKYKNDKVFDTVKYAILYTVSKWVEAFDREKPKTAMDIVSINYYLAYPRRKQLIREYDDALILSVLLAYEIHKLKYFRQLSADNERYFVKQFPYTIFAATEFSNNVTEDDFKLRDTVNETICELRKAYKSAYSSNTVNLKEKCTLDILKNILLILVEETDISKTHKDQLLSELSKMSNNMLYLLEVLRNKDLCDYQPSEYIQYMHDYQTCIRQVVKELNFNCI